MARRIGGFVRAALPHAAAHDGDRADRERPPHREHEEKEIAGRADSGGGRRAEMPDEREDDRRPRGGQRLLDDARPRELDGRARRRETRELRGARARCRGLLDLDFVRGLKRHGSIVTP